MSKLDLFRDFIRERLTTVALEIFGAVEKTFAEFQEEIYNSKEESARLTIVGHSYFTGDQDTPNR